MTTPEDEAGDYEVVVDFLPPRDDRALVVQVTSPSAKNPVHRTFRAMLAIGIQIVNMRVHFEGKRTVQVLHLTESDDRSPPAHRVSQVLGALVRMASG